VEQEMVWNCLRFINSKWLCTVGKSWTALSAKPTEAVKVNDFKRNFTWSLPRASAPQSADKWKGKV
jgi:hypothetical protein